MSSMGNKFTITTGPDWAARKGHLPLLRWLLKNTAEECTSSASDWAALNGHADVLQWLSDNNTLGCTDAAADWAAYKGHINILQWLYTNTHVRCSELSMMYAAGKGGLDEHSSSNTHPTEPLLPSKAWQCGVGRGNLKLLMWLHEHGAPSRNSAANFAFACGHTSTLKWLRSIGVERSVKADDHDVLARIRTLAASWG